MDELVVPYKGTQSSLRQCNPEKPKKWGLKVFCLCGGRRHKLELYNGKTLENSFVLLGVGKSGQVVLRLVKRVPIFCNYKLFFDNWFCSPALIVRLTQRGIQSVRTFLLNRAKNLEFSLDSEPQKKKDLQNLKCAKWTTISLL